MGKLEKWSTWEGPGSAHSHLPASMIEITLSIWTTTNLERRIPRLPLIPILAPIIGLGFNAGPEFALLERG